MQVVRVGTYLSKDQESRPIFFFLETLDVSADPKSSDLSPEKKKIVRYDSHKSDMIPIPEGTSRHINKFIGTVVHFGFQNSSICWVSGI